MRKKVQMIIEKIMTEEEIESEKDNLRKSGYEIAQNLSDLGKMYNDCLKEEYRKQTQWFLEDIIVNWFHKIGIQVNEDVAIKIETAISKYDGNILIKNIHFINQTFEEELIKKSKVHHLGVMMKMIKRGIDEETVYEKSEWLISKQTFQKKKTKKTYDGINTITKIDVDCLDVIVSEWENDYQTFSEVRNGILTLVLRPTEKYSEINRSIFFNIAEKESTIETMTLGEIEIEKLAALKERIVQEIKEGQLKNLF